MASRGRLRIKNQNVRVTSDDVLPLFCSACCSRFNRAVSCDEMFVECPACKSRNVHVFPPVKILEFTEARHYNIGSSKAQEAPEPVEGVIRVDFAEAFEETEIVEEVVL